MAANYGRKYIRQIGPRFIGGKKEVAEFEQYRQVGPIVKVVPFSMGKGVVIAVLNDPNYEVIHGLAFFTCVHMCIPKCIYTYIYSRKLGFVYTYLLIVFLFSLHASFSSSI
jgi:hypothetical protein